MIEAMGWPLFALTVFVGVWPLLMMFVWLAGGLSFWMLHERGKPTWETLPPLGPESVTVSVIVPCFNEEDNAEETIRALAAQVYPRMEIIAVNDGSRDGTAAVLDRLVAHIPRLRVVHLAKNQGKAMALRAGALVARGEVLVGIDGDAILHPHCVAWLAHRFAYAPRLGAVTGNPRIRNRSSLLGLLQVGEFSATIGLIKRSQRVDGRVFTVSGVVVAFRKTALHDVGWWTDDNLTEDVDVTWKLQRRRWTVHFEPNALAFILMPETVRGLWKQRLRWSTGGAQTVLRYARDLFRWQSRRMWGVFLEYAITLVWCYAMLVLTALSVLAILGFMPSWAAFAPALFSIWGMILSVACLVQFWASLAIDRRYEPEGKSSWRALLWVIWYPVVFWVLSAGSAIFGFPRALMWRDGKRARWVSPDRGFR